MTAVATLAGAVSHKQIDWHAIDWRKVHCNVRRLQARIVQAVKDGRWGKVKALQHLLTHSFSGKVVAIKRVTENHGKKTPGVDGQSWDTPEKKATAAKNLKQRGYRPLPLRRIYLPKPHGKRRPISIPAMKDRAMQALYLLALDPVAETTSDPNAYGFRPERGCADAMEQCHTVLSLHKGAAEWIWEGDIQSCFDTISHEWLLANIPMDSTILRKWLKAGFIDRHVFNKTEEGTPQGAICSPVLARLALNGLERTLREQYPKATARSRKAKVNVIVYADDFIITGRSKALLEDEVRPVVTAFLRERGLELSREKTKITHIADGFDFLGQHVRKHHNRILIKPAKKNVQRFLTKVRAVIKGNQQATTEHLILQLNPMIRGWANYHRFVASKQTLREVDNALFFVLWQWAKRRHPNKPQRWIKDKYFHHIKGRRWAFCAETIGKDGKRHTLQLFQAASIPITRYTKIKGEANPYDPAWELYFEDRLGLRMRDTLQERRKLLRLWFDQDGICPVCSQKITKESGWNLHHILRRTAGGKDIITNLVFLHPNCHRQVHSQGLEVSKPCPVKRAS
jgi:RNA-directed DNA polymerase